MMTNDATGCGFSLDPLLPQQEFPKGVRSIRIRDPMEDCCEWGPIIPILGADGPPYNISEYPRDYGGAGTNSSIWGLPSCPASCSCEDELKASACLPVDSTRFYEGGPVIGGYGRSPIMGQDYINKRAWAIHGQRYAGATVLSRPAGKPSPIPVSFPTRELRIKCGQSEGTEMKALMERCQQYLYRFRVRTKEWFRDFDPLNHGYVSAARFRRGLTGMGIGVGGKLALTEGEFDALVNFYRLADDPSMACWRRFDEDIESIFLQRGIEKAPALLTPSPARIVGLAPFGAINMEDIPMRVRQLARCSVARLKSRVEIERCGIKHFFKGFDRQRNGYVSRQQFKQTLSMLNYNFSAEELDAMSLMYSDATGFKYTVLLEDLEPSNKEPGWYAKYKNGRLFQLAKPPKDPNVKEHDLQRVMYQIQARMVRRRPILYNFLRDHDLLSHDRLKIIDFHRALDRAGFSLTPKEVEVLTCCFRSPDDETEIEWRCFLNMVETVFTIAGLERGPRLVPHPWRPLREMDLDKVLSDEEWCLYMSGMRRLAQRCHMRRLEFKPMFKDFDKPMGGMVSVNQFHRVLHTIGLAGIVTESELDAIKKRFGAVRGLRDEVDYFQFLKQIDAIILGCPITPEEMSPTGVKWYEELYPCC